MSSFILLLLVVICTVNGERVSETLSCSPITDSVGQKIKSVDCGSYGSFSSETVTQRQPRFLDETADPPVEVEGQRQPRFLDETADLPVEVEGVDEVSFTAFKSSEPQTGFLFSYKNHNDFITKIFGDCKKVTFIVHGFKTNTLEKFLKIKDALLTKLEQNLRPDVVVVVDWRDYSKLKKSDLFMGYKEAAQNANKIGSEVAHVVYLLVKHKNIDPSDVHLIGFSLGAQAMGVAGRKVVLSYGFKKKLGRISGLDPAGPRFEDFMCYLTKDDAQFVDIIHTNAGNNLASLKFGMTKATGHVDFYPNGGVKQPSCKNQKFTSCSHNQAVLYFEASLSASNCPFHAYKCNSWKNFAARNDRDPKCPFSASRMGYYSFTSKERGIFYLETLPDYPYCVNYNNNTPIGQPLVSSRSSSSNLIVTIPIFIIPIIHHYLIDY